MHFYPLRAMSKNNQYLVPFTLKDGPCLIDKEHFVLTAKEGSPILKYDTILWGSDIEDLFEGDIIEYKNKEYTIYYRRGVVAISEDKEYLDLSKVGKYKIVSNIYNRKIDRIPVRVNHKFKCGNLFFRLDELYGISSDKLLLNRKEGMLLDVDRIQQYAGMRNGTTDLYFGDNNLTLKRGRCVIPQGDKYYDLVRGEIING